ncbi:unnamed protein product [Paramecium pentaurelia]|uniref:USP domain-containing protein n=1 Tax=Paramecium pentaurelia TaxID=43138 RepID=A0A8S1RZU2_9CILI|nr:unnamed protein product [Paramecium pentaurelia]
MQNYTQANQLKSFRFTQHQLNQILKQYQTYGFTQSQILQAWQKCNQDQYLFHDVLIQQVNAKGTVSKDLLQSQLNLKTQTDQKQIRNSIFIQTVDDLQKCDLITLQEQYRTYVINSPNWKPTGLINLGNTCYINIMLQYMFNITSFRQLIFNIQLPTDKTNGQKVIQKLKELFALMQSGNRNYINPCELITSLQEYKPNILTIKGEQNDYNELQLMFLDVIENSLLDLNNDQVIQEFKSIFYGQSEENIIVNNKVIKTTPTQYSSITIEANEENLLKAFTSSRILFIDDYEISEKVFTKALIHQNIKTVPKILQFYINRVLYDSNQNQLIKNNKVFTFPSTIDVSQFIQDDSINQSKEMQELLKKEQEILQKLEQCGDHQSEIQFENLIKLFTKQPNEQFIIDPQPNLQSHIEMAKQLSLYQEAFKDKKQQLQMEFIKIEEQKKRVIEAKKTIYQLTALLIHSGTAVSGHYYCFIFDGKYWWKFNDRVVTQVEFPVVFAEAQGKTNKNTNVSGLIYEHCEQINQNKLIPLGNELEKFIEQKNQEILMLIDKQKILQIKSRILQRAAEHKIIYPKSQISKALIKYQYFEEFLQGNPNRHYFIRYTILDEELKLLNPTLKYPQQINEYKKYFISNSGIFPQNFDQMFSQDYSKYLFINNIISNFQVPTLITSINFQQVITQFQKYCLQLKNLDNSAFEYLTILFQAILLQGCFLCELLIQKNKLQEGKQLTQFIFETIKSSQFIQAIITQQLRENMKSIIDELEELSKKQNLQQKTIVTQPSILVPDSILQMNQNKIKDLSDVIQRFDELEQNTQLWIGFVNKILKSSEIIPQKVRLEQEMPLYFDKKLY